MSTESSHVANDGYRPPSAQREPPVAGHSLVPAVIAIEPTGTPFKVPAPVWPSASLVEVGVGVDADVGPLGPLGPLGPALVPVGGLPVAIDRAAGVNGPRRVTIESFGRAATMAAGVDGLLLRVSRADGVKQPGAARLTIDYSAFRWAYGGDWSSRLALWALPACALSTPGDAGCRGTRLGSVNDAVKGTVTAIVDVAGAADGATAASDSGTLVMLSAAASSPGGDYKATSLASAATWAAGGNSGDLSWTYPLRVPASLGGPSPTVELSYSSSRVDGRMASTNNQASWVGDGFEWQPGSIERRYNGCAEDMGGGANNTVKTGDLCWETDNASLSLASHAGELIKDAANPNVWHLRTDDGTRIERRTGGPNSDENGEWWLVTTRNGTQYWFGGRASSNATLTVPVFGNHSGEPCHAAAFKDSSCVQAYRWMLDHVVDPNGNTMSLTYVKETNKYGKNNKPEDDTVYDRDGYVWKIEYGTRGDVPGSAPMQVVFDVADRCLLGCASKDAVHWPDVPWDRECTADTCLISQNSPTFWSTKRLASIKTRVWGGAGYRDVESWTLTHSFPSSDQPTLWLERLAHAGHAGGTLAVPEIAFVGVAMPNRVDTNNDQYPAMNRYRMKTINSESGGKLDITYSGADCVRGTRVPDQNALHSNVLRCYPVRWTPEGHANPINDFFHKYVVTDVVEAELGGSSSRVLTHYDYVGDPAWHYTDDDGFIKKEDKTWSVWRGYATVRLTKGDAGEQTREERRFFRGMHGDKLPSGTRTVTLPAIAAGNVPAVNDEDAFAGMTRETITFDGPGGAEVSAAAHEPYQSAPTASRTINGTTVHARRVDTAVVHNRTALDGGRGHRTTTTSTVFDDHGMVIQTDDRGDDGATGDEKCTLIEYARDTARWIIDRRSRERVFAVPCSRALAGGLTADDVISDTRSSYDNLAFGAAPTRGNVTRVETLLAYDGSPSFITENVTTYDSYGRKLESTDIRGNKTVTTYQPPSGGPLTGMTETTQQGWVMSTTLEPAWNLPLTTIDRNERRIEFAYDPLGRLTSVWLPGRERATSTPSIQHGYLLRNSAPTVITTRRLNASGGTITTYKFFDSLMRDRQMQEQDENGGAGALVTDYHYDSAGRQVKIHDRYLAVDAGQAPVPPSTSLFVPTQNIPRLKVKRFDGANREIAVIDKVDGPPASAGGTEKWRTTTAYGGDRTDVTPPAGGTVTSSISDARGNIVELRQYHAGVAAGSPSGFDRMTYTYNRKNKLATVADALGNTWEYAYDLHGRKKREVDPDKGTLTTVYNAHGDVETSTDGRGVVLAYTYDALGRKTSLREGSAMGPKLVEWTYDNLSNGSVVKGQLAKVVRYEGTDEYIKEHLGYTLDYRVNSVKYTIPDNATASGVHGAYSYIYTYNQDGSTATTRLPGLGDAALGLETLTHGYNSLGKPSTLSTTLGGTLVAAPDASTPGTEYTSLGELAVIHLRHNSGARADIARIYDTGTRRLVQLLTMRATAPTSVADVWYAYDAIGNVTRISDLRSGDHQCFATDHVRRLTEAWTPEDGDCGAPRSNDALGGPASYWHSYSYDAAGNRKRLTEHGSAGERETGYAVPAGAHRLAGISTVDGGVTQTREYGYDASGNMVTRTSPAGTQTLTWDAEGHLATLQDATGTTRYIYDADGNRLVRKDPSGTTLYLPGQEVRYSAAAKTRKATRYYSHAGHVIAMRTAAGVTWLSGDHHDTAQISITALGQAASIRRETPFGELRGTTGTWPAEMDKGFVGGTNDNTGLSHLGAREYDSLIGRFISVDPAIDPNDAQQMQGYAYANNAPVTASDANGLWPNWNNLFRSVVPAWVPRPPAWVPRPPVPSWLDEFGGFMFGAVRNKPKLEIQGDLLTKVKTDPGMQAFRQRRNQEIAAAVASHTGGPGVVTLETTEQVEFGGQRAPDNMWDQLKRFWSPKYLPTWKVAANPLTWTLRHATVTARTEIHFGNSPADTYVVTHYVVQDKLDLRPHSHGAHDFGLLRHPSDNPYDAATIVLGTLWHDVLRRNDNTPVTATWTETARGP